MLERPTEWEHDPGNRAGLLLLGEELLALLHIWNNSVTSWFPSSRTNFSIFVGVLEGLHQSQRLVYRAAHRQIIDGDLPQDAFIVNHKQTSVGDAFILFQDAVIAGDGLSQVSQQWDVHGAQATLLPGCVDPCQMAEMRVGGSSDDLAADFTKLSGPFTERDDLGRTHKGEIKWIEEQHDILPSVVRELNVFKLSVHHSCGLELRSRLTDLSVSRRHAGHGGLF